MNCVSLDSWRAGIRLAVDSEAALHEYAVMFKRRLGLDPHTGGNATPGLRGCPDVWELTNGDFAVIGRDITPEATAQLPAGVTCGPEERVVVVPRRTLLSAKPDIPENA